MRGFLIDSNVWLAIAFDRHASHKAALQWISNATPQCPACFCRATEQSVLRLLSTPPIQTLHESPLVTNQGAIQLLNEWQSQPNVACVDEPTGTRELWLHLANRNTASPKLWMDAYLAAFAISGELRLTTYDKAFSQFVPDGLDLHILPIEI